MSYHIEKNDIVIDGFELGIAESPYKGIANLRSANIASSPGHLAVNFKTAAMNKPPVVSALAFTVNTTTDVFTVASTTGWYNGMAIELITIVTSTGISTGRVYWIGDLTATTFKLYVNPSRDATSVVNVTGSNGSGTLSSYTLGKPIDKTISYEGPNLGAQPFTHYLFILDDAGRVWWVDNTGGTPTSNLIYLGNDTLTGTTGRGIAMFKGYLIVFRTATQDALNITQVQSGTDLDGVSGWVYGWNSISTSLETPRPIVVGQDDVLYYDNSERVGSISENVGVTFDPSSGASYTENTNALDLPEGKGITALGELGTELLIGSIDNFVYPWDRISPSFRLPIRLPENYTKKIITIKNIAYIFAGNKGKIYRTTGSSAETWKKIPDHLAGVFEPYFAWLDADSQNDQLYFSFTTSQNDGTAIATLGGVWAIDLITEALRHAHQLSYGNGGTVSMITRNPLADDGTATTPSYTPAGSGLYVGWDNSGSYGVDEGSSNPYSNYETILETEIIPIGNYTFPVTLSQIEYKLARPLVSGEAVRVSFRKNLTASYEVIYTVTDAGAVSAPSDTTFEDAEWVQFKVELSSTNTTPSHVPLRELRIRQ